jgi:hypothetical protein
MEPNASRQYVTNNVSNSQVIQGENISVTVQDAFSQVRLKYGEEAANALRHVADAVARSGSKEASELLDGFQEELRKPEPKRPILRSLWRDLTAALPALGQMADLALKMSQLFGS